ncbi:MAG: nucleotide sugar dehydrogenase [Proteobacteria bacterium]|nr:nucleotide sugar dehydrogenase [Pseudomonadota bacterium]
MKIAVYGLGYVGSTTMACLAEMGHEMVGTDPNPGKVELINAGKSPMVEPGLPEMLHKHRATGRIRATTDGREAFKDVDACLLCVGTPPAADGFVDQRVLEKVVLEIADLRLESGRTCPMLVRSTALPVVHQDILAKLEERLAGRQSPAYVVHPEFLREGNAIEDFFHPSKIVFGCSGSCGRQFCESLYPGIEAPVVFTDPLTAAVAKYADNCFHAVKVTFANEIGALCKSMGVDSRPVMDVFCLDTKLNISPVYFKPGFAYGGSCLGKDLAAMNTYGRRAGVKVPMLAHVEESNLAQIRAVAERIMATGTKSVGLFGLAFKERTDDLRDSPLVILGSLLDKAGVQIRIYDPAIYAVAYSGSHMAYALEHLPDLRRMISDNAPKVIGESDTIVISRSFPGLAWRDLPWRAGHSIMDLNGRLDLAGVDVPVTGLYW